MAYTAHVTAYNLKDGSQAWRAYSVGPDDQILFDANTTELGKPVGKDSSLKTWQGDQWKIGGGGTWGWISYDPQLNLIYYGSGNPSTWNPVQRPGDNKWSMTIFARNPDTGIAKWVYQMTPHDQWDYDGVNEMILADINVKGQPTKALVHFDRNGFGYTLNRETGALLVAEKYDPKVNWATQGRHADRPAGGGRPVRTRARKGEDKNYTGRLPSGARIQRPATGGVFAKDRTVLRPDQPRLHGLRAVQGVVHGRSTLCRGDIVDVPAAGRQQPRQLHRLGCWHGKIVWSDPEPFSVWSGALATAGDVVFYGTLEGYLKAVDMQTGKELYQFKTPSGIIGNVNTFTHGGKQYIAVLSGVGGWAGIGMAAGLTKDTDGLGAVGAYKALANYTQLGGVLTVFGLPE